MIIAQEAAIQLMKQDHGLNELVEQRIADKHRFGNGWSVPCKAVQVRADGGPTELYVEVQRQRLEIICYGESHYEALRVFSELQSVCRRTVKQEVSTWQGKGLVYWLNLVSAPSAWRDEEIGVDAILVFAEIAVAENPIS